jgi:peptidoglycan/xylan/chitin deacetylase (PgdA/CDA1 family)
MFSNRHGQTSRLGPLILCYHAVASGWSGSSAVSEDVLATQLGLLARRGYVGLTFAECERRRSEGVLPTRSVVVTFDDGYASVLRAKPILEALRFPATVFVVTQFVDSEEPLTWPGIGHWLHTEYAHEMRSLTWGELETLQNGGWEVGSHTVTHRALTTLGAGDLERELLESRHAIETRIGSCVTLAYPYGVADERVASFVENSGYLAACSLSLSHRVNDRYRRARVGLYDHDRGWRLQTKITPVGRWLRTTPAVKAGPWVRTRMAASSTPWTDDRASESL